ncbi:hypothetical protein GCM10012276_15920 [Nocardioides deserti]|nr:hypothetical protein GCM10012276_15920 [Nocardioides deserti]
MRRPLHRPARGTGQEAAAGVLLVEVEVVELEELDEEELSEVVEPELLEELDPPSVEEEPERLSVR